MPICRIRGKFSLTGRGAVRTSVKYMLKTWVLGSLYIENCREMVPKHDFSIAEYRLQHRLSKSGKTL